MGRKMNPGLLTLWITRVLYKTGPKYAQSETRFRVDCNLDWLVLRGTENRFFDHNIWI